ncbi:MAG TPA: hypothetical protein VM571_10625 [Noviherbaspirillum sp.]|nr:hypothetical protein [Noviherbaspirillum sp.]
MNRRKTAGELERHVARNEARWGGSVIDGQQFAPHGANTVRVTTKSGAMTRALARDAMRYSAMHQDRAAEMLATQRPFATDIFLNTAAINSSKRISTVC